MAVSIIILSVVMIIVGIVLLALGVFFWQQNNKANIQQPWYVWTYLIIGVILVLLGAVLLGWSVVHEKNKKKTVTQATVYQQTTEGPVITGNPYVAVPGVPNVNYAIPTVPVPPGVAQIPTSVIY